MKSLKLLLCTLVLGSVFSISGYSEPNYFGPAYKPAPHPTKPAVSTRPAASTKPKPAQHAENTNKPHEVSKPSKEDVAKKQKGESLETETKAELKKDF